MKLLVGTLAAVAAHPVRQDLVDQIRAMNLSWEPQDVADNPMRFIPEDQIAGTLGALGTSPEVQSPAADWLQAVSEFFKNPFGLAKQEAEIDRSKFKHVREDLRPKPKNITGDPALPQYYNIQEQFPECQPLVQNQALCGACWAFSAAGMLEDRFCLRSEGQIRTTLSPQDMINCDYENYGCTGGYLVPGIDFLETEGTTSLECMSFKNKRQGCHFQCDDPSVPYEKYYCKQGSLKILTDRHEIQNEIYTNGPVVVGLFIYEDLYSYREGIYTYAVGDLVGGHAIRAVGWGHDDDGHLYWIC